MKRIIFLLFFCAPTIIAQNYVDLVTVGYAKTFNNEFEGSSQSTDVTSFDVDISVPIVLNDTHAFITGGFFSRNHLQLFPSAPHTSLYNTALKLGLASTWNEQWSTTIVALPKIASDYKSIGSNDFYMGGFALLKFQKKENLIYRFGIYGSQEAFGFFTTPIIGWYYLSPNQRFEMDMSLPVAANINYTKGALTYGVDYIGIGRSFNIDEDNANLYADVTSLEFSSYVQFNAFEKSVLLRAKFGYSSNNYEIYRQGETIDLGLSAFSFGDDRTQLNPVLSGSFFVKMEAIYRFQLSTKEER